jgi:hypothetical protein
MQNIVDNVPMHNDEGSERHIYEQDEALQQQCLLRSLSVGDMKKLK